MIQPVRSTERPSADFDRQDERVLRERTEEKLAFLQAFNHLLVESTGDCIMVVDEEEHVLSVNKTGRQLFGLDNDKAVLNRSWTDLFNSIEPKSELRAGDRAVSHRQFQGTSRTAAGETRFWRITFSPFGKEHGRPNRFVVMARDMTEHMLVEKALRQSEEAFRRIFEENPIGIVLAGPDFRITKVNNALSAMLGYSERELSGKNVLELAGAGSADQAENLQRLFSGEVRLVQSEMIFETKRKQPVWGHMITSVLRDGENTPFGVFQMIENIEDRKTTEAQVLAYQAQLQSMASEVSFSEERERRRIATNLHDCVSQSLAFARLKLASLGGENGDVVIKEVRELIEQAIVDTRSLTFELSPPVLYELGLVAGLEWLTRKIEEEHGIQTRFHDDGQPKSLDENFRVALFQAVRELLVNVVKHARASHAQVTVRRDADALRIIVEDDGIGFELSQISARHEAPRTFGLFNIRERLEYLGGHVKIRSEPARGTRVTLIAPLKIKG
jgi:PAS domain S-box-containing protein